MFIDYTSHKNSLHIHQTRLCTRAGMEFDIMGVSVICPENAAYVRIYLLRTMLYNSRCPHVYSLYSSVAHCMTMRI